MPNTRSRMPTTMRRSSMGTHCSSEAPSAPTITASAIEAAKTPVSDVRQPLVMPTARMIVIASTISTVDARKAARTRKTSCIVRSSSGCALPTLG
jgi:hypothetical protein